MFQLSRREPENELRLRERGGEGKFRGERPWLCMAGRLGEGGPTRHGEKKKLKPRHVYRLEREKRGRFIEERNKRPGLKIESRLQRRKERKEGKMGGR